MGAYLDFVSALSPLSLLGDKTFYEDLVEFKPGLAD